MHMSPASQTTCFRNYLGAPLRDLRQSNQPRMPLLPVLVDQARRHELTRHRKNRVPPKRDRQPVQALHPNIIVILVGGHFFLTISRMPFRVILDREQEV